MGHQLAIVSCAIGGASYASKTGAQTTSRSDYVPLLEISVPDRIMEMPAVYLRFNGRIVDAQSKPGNYQARDILSVVDKPPVQTIRYRGGTSANFFDWQTQKLDTASIEQLHHPRMLQSVVGASNSIPCTRAQGSVYSGSGLSDEGWAIVYGPDSSLLP